MYHYVTKYLTSVDCLSGASKAYRKIDSLGDPATAGVPVRQEMAIESLLDTKSRSLRLGRECCAGIAGAIYLFLCNAYVASLSSDAICQLLGIDVDCILNRASKVIPLHWSGGVG